MQAERMHRTWPGVTVGEKSAGASASVAIPWTAAREPDDLKPGCKRERNPTTREGYSSRAEDAGQRKKTRQRRNGRLVEDTTRYQRTGARNRPRPPDSRQTSSQRPGSKATGAPSTETRLHISARAHRRATGAAARTALPETWGSTPATASAAEPR